MISSGTARTQCYGNLALVPAYPRYRVVEGGQRQCQPSQEAHIMPNHEVRTQAHRRMAPTSRQSSMAYARALLLAMATVALAIAVLSLVWHATDIMEQRRVRRALQDVSYQTVVVHPGDTLWGIAQTHAIEGCSTEELVSFIRDINYIQDSFISVGMQLYVPCK